MVKFGRPKAAQAASLGAVMPGRPPSEPPNAKAIAGTVAQMHLYPACFFRRIRRAAYLRIRSPLGSNRGSGAITALRFSPRISISKPLLARASGAGT